MTTTFVSGSVPLRERVAAEVRAFMARRGYSQTRLAELLSWRQQYLSRRLTGHVALDADDLEALAEVFDVDPEAFFRAPQTRGHIMPIIRRALALAV